MLLSSCLVGDSRSDQRQPPGGGAQVPVPESAHDDSDLDMPIRMAMVAINR